ncbi:MAG: hypothetical protein JJE39_09495, partial [Vicinamibacteria bacterium]|nr:hypothetical protein [Vicinamibacteria bacterium]
MRPPSLLRFARRALGMALIGLLPSSAYADDKESTVLAPTLSRDGDQVTLHANPLRGEVIKVDGRLDEAI